MTATFIRPQDYPALKAYLDSLPEGLQSLPEVRTRASFNILLRHQLGSVLDNAKLPQALRAHLQADWADDDWIPATIYGALCALARDRLWRTDRDYFSGMFNLAKNMYSSISYRAVMFMLSPSFIIQGSSKRWHHFHQGTALKLFGRGKDQAELVLTFPSPIYSELVLASLGATFCAAADGAGGKNTRIAHHSSAPGEATFLLEWDLQDALIWRMRLASRTRQVFDWDAVALGALDSCKLLPAVDITSQGGSTRITAEA